MAGHRALAVFKRGGGHAATGRLCLTLDHARTPRCNIARADSSSVPDGERCPIARANSSRVSVDNALANSSPVSVDDALANSSSLTVDDALTNLLRRRHDIETARMGLTCS